MDQEELVNEPEEINFSERPQDLLVLVDRSPTGKNLLSI